ncbi:late histone H1 [Klebsiella aerogenes]|nr:late histone H1 [Klebsiella aerogenes]
MKKSALLFGLFAIFVCSAANAAQGQAVANAKAACQNNPTQCANAKGAAKKEAQAAKNACAKNQSACNNAKAKVKSASQR